MKVDSCSSSCLLPFQQFLPVMKNDWSKKKLVGFSSCPLSRGWKTVGRSSTVRVSSISSIFSQYFPNGSRRAISRHYSTVLLRSSCYAGRGRETASHISSAATRFLWSTVQSYILYVRYVSSDFEKKRLAGARCGVDRWILFLLDVTNEPREPTKRTNARAKEISDVTINWSTG